jgi:hypothetical protein
MLANHLHWAEDGEAMMSYLCSETVNQSLQKPQPKNPSQRAEALDKVTRTYTNLLV